MVCKIKKQVMSIETNLAGYMIIWNGILFQTCKAVYDRIIDLRIATPQIVMNYGLFLEENNYFEEAFKV
jgi:hypothetical protein